MMNKKGMLVRDFIVVLILFGAVVGLASLIAVDMANSGTGYNRTDIIDEDFQERYDTLTETVDTVDKMQNATASGEGISVISTYTTVFKATFSIISLTFGGLWLINDAFANFAEDFSMPSVIANMIFPALLAIILAIIIFVIISSVSKGRM